MGSCGVIQEDRTHDRAEPGEGCRTLKVYGLGEAALAERLKALPPRPEDLFMGLTPHFPETHVTLSLKGRVEGAAGELNRREGEIRALLGAYVFGSGNQTMAGVVGDLLRKRGLTLSLAESCTGGLIGNLVTDVPGSSAYFAGGVVVYGNPSKVSLLGVLPETLEGHGAVSDPTVRQMVEGVRRLLPSDVGLAVTGIAGPEGGSEEKPVGTVHMGLASEAGTLTGKYRFEGNRRQVKLNTAMMALDWVRRFLHGYPLLPGL